MAAFFDLDNTLVRGSSLYHFACELVRKKVIPRREVIRFARQELQYVMRRSEPAGVAASATARALALSRAAAKTPCRSSRPSSSRRNCQQ